jgi:hypothetical protein
VTRVQVFLYFLILCNSFALAQDTLNFQNNYSGASSFWLVVGKDTTMVSVYPNKKKESIKPIKNGRENGTYTRWYENGSVMWKKNLVDGKANGDANFFDIKGNKLATIFYENDSINTIPYVAPGKHLIFGNVFSSNKVYGGMQGEDGSSNVSEHSGPYGQLKMNVFLVDSVKPPKYITTYYTDSNGDFFFSSPKGKIAFFPANIDIDKIAPGQFCATETPYPSGHSSWSMPCPLTVKEEKIIKVKLHYSSVGYAP